ncbi:hypothetical protein Plhal304r1_c058g0144961 [Plasmopara halstedii]
MLTSPIFMQLITRSNLNQNFLMTILLAAATLVVNSATGYVKKWTICEDGTQNFEFICSRANRYAF